MIIEIILIFLGVVLLGTLIFAGWLIGLYNTLVVAVQDIRNMMGNIKTEYQRRADLFMNLVESVKGSTRFEKDTLTQVIAARGGNLGKTPAETMSKLKGLEGALSKLMVVFERYPELKATKNYEKLMEEIRITEDRINIARTDYNAIVRDYNIMTKSFPQNYFARIFKFGEELYFENEPESTKAPKIDMSL
jgi:LemA protein